MDNGQHVLMGCYKATLRYLTEAGVNIGENDAPRLHPPHTHAHRAAAPVPLLQRMRGLALPFRHANGNSAWLRAGGGPHPLSLVQAFLRYDLLPLPARLGIMRTALRLRWLSHSALQNLDAYSAEDWLRRCAQGKEAIALFWRPVILATMNTEPADASAKLLIVVLREIFFAGAEAADILLPTVGLSQLLIEPVRQTLEARGARIRTGVAATAVETYSISDGRLAVAGVQADERYAADSVVLAVAPWACDKIATVDRDSSVAVRGGIVQWILPDSLSWRRFIPSEILSIHVWTTRSLGEAPMTGLLGTTLQWVFYKGRSRDASWHYSCTVSAASGQETTDPVVFRALLLKELRLLNPELAVDDILHILPVREKRATFVPAPGMEQFRLLPQTSVQGLFVAGDATATGLPSTIEGAVRSGVVAAEAVLRGEGEVYVPTGGPSQVRNSSHH
ncbi:MAG: FAD-dependent oxidoreductase [Bacteroidetes bacterium]|nr:FAD-dependent oxidoreductase [Bacteroidota bacterium]